MIFSLLFFYPYLFPFESLVKYILFVSFLLQRFAAFLSPLTYGRVTISVGAVYISKVMMPSFICGIDHICVFCYFFLFLCLTSSHQTPNIWYYHAIHLLLLDCLSHYYKICIDKAGLFYCTKWTWSTTAWLPKSSTASITFTCQGVSPLITNFNI